MINLIEQRKKIKFALLRHFSEVLKTKTSDHSVASGFALGVLISLLPTPGFSILLGIALVAIFKQINKFALFLAMAVWNIWTVMPLYWLSFKLGDLIFAEAPVVNVEIQAFAQALSFTRRFLIGNLIVSIPFSILNYYLVRYIIIKVRTGREDKKLNQ